MSLGPGTYRLSPQDATLSVRTGRAGAASKAGHDLLLEVTAWEAAIVVGDSPDETQLELTADPTSLRVRDGTGGIKALGDDDIASIQGTIDEKVLRRREIAFRSTRAEPPSGDHPIHVEGELTLFGNKRPIAFDLRVGDDAVAATATVSQSDWGMKPYSALLGALKVADEVEVALAGRLRAR